MAKKITELTSAGAVTGATDLLWIEQAGAARKITVDSLFATLPDDGTVTDSMIRWDGAAYVEETQIQASAAGVFSILDSGLTDGLAESHDSTNFLSVFTNTAIWDIDGLTSGINFNNDASAVIFQIFSDSGTPRVNVTNGWDFEVRSAGNLVVRDSSNVDSVSWSHDGADLNQTFVTTEDWNITGLTGGINVTTNDGTPLFLNGTINGTYTLSIDNDSNGTTSSARTAISSGDANVALFVAGTGRTSTIVTNGPTGRQSVLRTLDATHPLILATSNTERIRIEDAQTSFRHHIEMGDDNEVRFGGGAAGGDMNIRWETTGTDYALFEMATAGTQFKFDTPGTTTAIYLQQAGVTAAWFRVTATQTEMRGLIHGGPVVLLGENNSGTGTTLIHADPDGAAQMYYAGDPQIRSKAHDQADDITGGDVQHFDGIYYDIGIAPLVHVNTSVALTVSETHILKAIRWTGGAAGLDITLADDSGMRVNSWGMIWNESGSTKDILAGTGVTIYWFDGAGGTTKTATQFLTLADGGAATWTKISDTLYRVWGVGVGG